MSLPKIAVIVGSVRKGRFADKPARWFHGLLKKRTDVTSELLDLVDYPMPFFDQPVPPAGKKEPYPYESVEKWTAKIGAADGYVIIAPEYNHGPPAVLKNALDWVYQEWARKPVTFVSYGGVNGARSVEQLRQVAVELHLAPIRQAVHIPKETFALSFQNKPVDEELAKLDKFADSVIDDLLWWTHALRGARG